MCASNHVHSFSGVAGLAHHGESVDADAEFRTRVVKHVTEGYWLGNGDPSIMFEPDLKTPTSAEVARYEGERAYQRGLQNDDGRGLGRQRYSEQQARLEHSNWPPRIIEDHLHSHLQTPVAFGSDQSPLSEAA